MSLINSIETRPKHKLDGEQVQKRRLVNAFWQPFIQFRLLMLMLGSTVLVAILSGVYLYFTLADVSHMLTGRSEHHIHYGPLMEKQLFHLLGYCVALFVLYMLLLATVCVAYTQRLIGPLRPFSRHVECLIEGDYSSRIELRKDDLNLYKEYADKLNSLATSLNAREDSDS